MAGTPIAGIWAGPGRSRLQGLISPPHEVMEAGSPRQAHDLASQKLRGSALFPDTELDFSSPASGGLVEDTVSVEESMLII